MAIVTALLQSQVWACEYEAEPINWDLRFCAHEAETDDEISLQLSPCFKAADKDLHDENKCKSSGK